MRIIETKVNTLDKFELDWIYERLQKVEKLLEHIPEARDAFKMVQTFEGELHAAYQAQFRDKKK
jgi:hypothetical protein